MLERILLSSQKSATSYREAAEKSNAPALNLHSEMTNKFESKTGNMLKTTETVGTLHTLYTGRSNTHS